MKKYFFSAILTLLCCTVFTSCEKDEIGGTATQSMAGQWYVTIDAVDESGNPIDEGEDYFGVGRVLMLTYNTAANDADKMWIDDLGNFDLPTVYDNSAYPSYSFKNLVNINLNALTFSSDEAENKAGEFPITIEDGKILKGAGTQNNGSKCDSIVFYVKYVGDPWFPDDGYAKYKVSGVRYSGLEEND